MVWRKQKNTSLSTGEANLGKRGRKMVSIEGIRRAAENLRGVAARTALVHAPSLLEGAEELYLKAENLQMTGSFKLRGAYNKIAELSPEECKKGVIACSAGNHAQGVAMGAAARGTRAVICIPEGAPISKIEATRRYGAEVVLSPGVYDDSYLKAVKLQKEHGYVFVHPFDDEKVIEGQGTIALEILEDLPEPDLIIAAVGGGGLISGIGCAVKTLYPRCKVIGVEAEGADAMLRSIRAGETVTLPAVHTIADGIAVKRPGDLTLQCCRTYVDDIVTVSDSEVAEAMLLLMEKQKMVAEGAGAAPLAAVLSGKVDVKGKKAVLVVSGGNADVTMLSRIITRGLTRTGRMVEFSVDMDDREGQLLRALTVIKEVGCNVLSVEHDRAEAGLSFGQCRVRFLLETKNQNHIRQLFDALHENQFVIL